MLTILPLPATRPTQANTPRTDNVKHRVVDCILSLPVGGASDQIGANPLILRRRQTLCKMHQRAMARWSV